MVVNAHRFCSSSDWHVSRHGGWFCSGSLHLHIVLMDRKKELESIIVIAAALMIIHFVLIYRYETSNQALVPIALGLLLVGFLSPWLTSKIIWLWFKLSEGIGYVMSRVILSIIFFLMLFPISLLYRMFNKDVLKLQRNGGSTYTDRSHTFTASDLENPW